MRILITGVSGQIGSELIRSLQPYDTVLAADRKLIDLSMPATLTSRLSELRPDFIINAAAYTAVDRAEREQDIAFAVNGVSPGALAGWAARAKVPIIHFSTDYVFDGRGHQPWKEEDSPAPLSVYGASKLAGEQAIERTGGDHLIIRTSWVYAAHGNNFLRTIIQLGNERDELRIVDDQIGAPTAAGCVAHIVARIVHRERENLPAAFSRIGRKLNIAASGETSWFGFAQEILCKLRNRGHRIRVQSVVPVRSAEYQSEANRPLNSRLDLTRLRTVFGIVPPNWNELLEREINQLTSCES
jgi:dTDP-4-dehydrorhamnose reductase